jgi:flagellar L-ring protein precursor FlgH
MNMFPITLRICFATIAGISYYLLESPQASGQSLFERRSVNQVDQYRNYAARHRGDLLSIMINESTDVENRDERSLDKTGQSSINGALDYGLGGNLGTAIGDGNLGKSSSSSRNFSGDTEFRSARQFSDKFTVTIVDVMPNGNLVVRGERAIAVQGDERRLRLSGIIRQYDVLPNNTVPSHLVADLKIELEAKGAEQSYNKQGWFSRRVNRVWPF